MGALELRAQAVAAAQAAKLDPQLVLAIIEVESAWNVWAVRYEPGWRWFWYVTGMADKLGLSTQTEESCQRTSWGLMQVMGAVARERGYQGHLPALCSPELGLKYGCAQLAWLQVYAREESDLIAMYNGGRGALKKTEAGMYPNQRYVDKVHAKLVALRGLQA